MAEETPKKTVAGNFQLAVKPKTFCIVASKQREPELIGALADKDTVTLSRCCGR
jgi:hypothetical protein